mgnify:CR=1 FL=1
MASGNAVCGSSAIAAVEPVIGAETSEKRTSIAMVNLMGTILMLSLPFLGTWIFGNNDLLRGALIGGTEQSVGQVVASATMVNPNTTTLATLFKIMRIIMLVFVVLYFHGLCFKINAFINVLKYCVFVISFFVCVHVLYICPQSDLGERIIEPFLYNAA